MSPHSLRLRLASRDAENRGSKFGPDAAPRIDLRAARIIDDHCDETGATQPIRHHVPDDVARTDLDYYHDVSPFIPFEGLLFYLYPVALFYERDSNLNCVGSFMYSLDRHFPVVSTRLSDLDPSTLIEGIRWLWHAGTPADADWVQCRNLQSAIGMSVNLRP